VAGAGYAVQGTVVEYFWKNFVHMFLAGSTWRNLWKTFLNRDKGDEWDNAKAKKSLYPLDPEFILPHYLLKKDSIPLIPFIPVTSPFKSATIDYRNDDTQVLDFRN
jgi:hypothetical protein